MNRRRFLCCAVAGCASTVLVPAGVAYDAFRIEPNWPQITKHEVKLPQYPRNQKPLKIVQLSDLHRGPLISEDHIRKLVPLCNGLEPDIVVITGDFISKSRQYAASCARALSGLKSTKGVFAVLGNHDYWAEGGGDLAAALSGSGIRVFKNGNLNVAENVWLIGLDDVWAGSPDIPEAFRDVPGDAVRLVISHSPKIFPSIRDMNVFAMVGHTHGGQYNIPLVPRKYLPGLLGWEYIKGWYRQGHSSMYINSGIGMVAAPIRFFCRPEISLFTCGPASISS